MSKKKRTLEELLEEALVPEDELPYEIPENWIWAEIKHILKPMLNTPPSKLNIENFHYIDVESIDNKKQVLRAYKELSTNEAPSRAQRKVSKNDVLISLVRPYLKNIAKIDFQDEKLISSTAFYVCSVKENINANYLYYYLMSPYATEFLIKHTKGDNSPSVKNGDFEAMPIPIANINEQKRIADKIEILFAKIDEAKRLIDEVRETFEFRRVAVLEKAFKELNQYIKVGEIAKVIDPQPSHRTPPRFEGGIPYIGIKECDYEKDIIDFQNARPVSETVLQEHIVRYDLKEGDFIIGKIGTVGNPFILPIDREGKRTYTLSANVLLIQPDEKIIEPKYLYYLFKSNIINNQISENINSTTQAAFGIKKARELSIPICSLEKQREIVKSLETIFYKEKEALRIINNKLDISLVKQSILSKAFKGELGTNDSADEQAIELLKSILQEKL